MASLEVNRISKRFGQTQALRDISLKIPQGEFFCLTGPPGAGKTTLLRIIAGLTEADAGEVAYDGRSMFRVHPRDRNVAMVFENLALYPNRTAYENIASPLRKAKLRESEIKRRVEDVADTLRILPLLGRKPATYSGGERQRVALARAMVRRPDLFLLDEPLANLDALIRLNMRSELKRLQMDLRETFVYTTHDHTEALSMGDRLAVIHEGVIHQVGPPQAVYHRPKTRYVGEFLGSPGMNFLPCTLKTEGPLTRLEGPGFQVNVPGVRDSLNGRLKDPELLMGVRAEHLRIEPPSAEGIPAELSILEPLGAETILYYQVGGAVVRALSPPGTKRKPGERACLAFAPEHLHLFDRKTEERIN